MIRVKKESILPSPTDELIDEMQDYFEVNFPQDYRSFLKQNNGAVPLECQFDYNGHSYAVERFLCMLPNELLNEFVEGCYDIGVVETQLDDRLGDDGDETGPFIIPIAVLFAGERANRRQRVITQ